MSMNFVPVVDANRKPLMPCSGKRARKLIQRGEATPFWSHGVFCIRLNREPSARHVQDVAVGVDPGGKREGYSVRSEAHDYLNVDADAKQYVGRKLEARRTLRRSRRRRKTPCRAPKRGDDNHKRIPAGTRARWAEKARVLHWLAKLFPITHVIVEDVAAVTRKGKRRWNASFSPLEVGKAWFYDACRRRWNLSTMQGYETKQARDACGLRKTTAKRAERWDAHCVDAWVLAAEAVGGTEPRHRRFMRLIPVQRQRRCLHVANAAKGGVRKPYGRTNKGGVKTATLVRNRKGDTYYTAGIQGAVIRLHDLRTGKRMTSARHRSLTIYRPLGWRFYAVADGVEPSPTASYPPASSLR